MSLKAVFEISSIDFLIFFVGEIQVFETDYGDLVCEPSGSNFDWEVFHFPTYFLTVFHFLTYFLTLLYEVSIKGCGMGP